MLDISSVSAEYQSDLVLRHVAPEYYGGLTKKLRDNLKFYEEKQVSTRFKPVEIDVDRKNFSVTIGGNLTSYVAGKRISESKDKYQLRYRYKNGELLLTSFVLIEEVKP